MKERVGFIGLGTMGQHMAQNMRKAGHEVHVYDVVPERVRQLAESAGTSVCGSVREVGERAERPKQVNEVKEVFKQVDALLTPTMPTVAPLLTAGSEVYDRGRQFTIPISWLGLPSVSVPCGFGPTGLPIGLQIIGNELQEGLLLRIAAAYEDATRFYKRRPPIYCGGSA